MTRRLAGDRGQVGGIEVLPFGFLVFVAGTLIVANAWAVVDTRLAVTAASREAVRAYVESDDEAEAYGRALTRAQETLEAYGRGGDAAEVAEPVLEGDFARCVRVSITVSVEVPAVRVPFIGGFGELDPVTATASELIDPFRDGLTGEAQC